MDAVLKIYPDKDKLAEKLARDVVDRLKLLLAVKDQVDIAISGGSTPLLFFSKLEEMKPDINWEQVKVYWVDERCVPPDHPESNYGAAYRAFIRPLGIPQSSVFRMKGEEEPWKEAERYSELILDNVSPDMNFPVFDMIFLGMGTDGHTASVFPGQEHVWEANALCTVGVHPSGQNRITMTGHLINAAARVIFLVTGEEKADLVYDIITKQENSDHYPASRVNPVNGELEWYLDEKAAGKVRDL